MGLRESWRKLFNTVPTEEVLERALRNRQEEVEYARDVIVALYVNSQVLQAGLTKSLRHTLKESQSGQKQLMARMKFDIESRSLDRSDQLLDVAVEHILGVLSEVGDEERREIQVTALVAAQTYWQTRLDQSDITADETMLGRRRLTQISDRLDKFGQKAEEA